MMICERGRWIWRVEVGARRRVLAVARGSLMGGEWGIFELGYNGWELAIGNEEKFSRLVP